MSIQGSEAPGPSAQPISVRLVGMRKEYPGTLAVDFDPGQELAFLAGEIHAVVGENGAGKSTLLSMIAGVTPITAGEMWLDAERHAPTNAIDARRRGVDIVLQEPGLIDTMSVEENLLLGRERLFAPHQFFAPPARKRLARAAMSHIKRTIPLDVSAGSLNLENQKFVELARALSQGPRVLVIDEMTANLSESGVEELFELLRAFAKSGGTVLYVSHYLEEVAILCDRVTVMKDGRLVRTLDAKTTSEDELSTLMVGRTVKEQMFRADTQARTSGDALLQVTGLGVAGKFENVSFTLHRGEVFGLGGLIGCGSETLALALFGDVHPTAGEILLDGKPVTAKEPREAIALGLALVPGDREREGLILNLSLERNISLASLPWITRRGGVIAPGVEKGIAKRLIGQLRIVSRSHTDVPFSLSGGNRQKVVLAKWLVREPRVLILHNPTRGVDVGGKAEIYGVIRGLADNGVGIVLISDELPELIGLSDTLMIMRRGHVSSVVTRDAAPDGGAVDRVHAVTAMLARWRTTPNRRIVPARLVPFVALIVVIVFFGITGGTRFLSVNNALFLLQQSAVIAIPAFGVTLVIIAGSIDLSIGSVVALTGMVAAVVDQDYGAAVPAVIAALLVGIGCGLFNGLGFAVLRVPSFMVTLGMLSIARGLTIIVSGSQPLQRRRDDPGDRHGFSPCRGS